MKKQSNPEQFADLAAEQLAAVTGGKAEETEWVYRTDNYQDLRANYGDYSGLG